MSTPVPRKPSTLRVARPAARARQMDAIWASATPIGRPASSRSVTISAYRTEARSSKGRTRPWKSSVRMPRITAVSSRLRGPPGSVATPSRNSAAVIAVVIVIELPASLCRCSKSFTGHASSSVSLMLERRRRSSPRAWRSDQVADERLLGRCVCLAILREPVSELAFEFLIRDTSRRVFPQPVTEREIPRPLRVVGTHHVKMGDAMIRLVIEREQMAALIARIAPVDPSERFQEADDAIYPDIAMNADRDIDDGLGRAARG